MIDFLGKGWKFPIKVNGRGGLSFASGATSIAEEFLGLADSGVQTVLAWRDVTESGDRAELEPPCLRFLDLYSKAEWAALISELHPALLETIAKEAALTDDVKKGIEKALDDFAKIFVVDPGKAKEDKGDKKKAGKKKASKKK